MPSFSIVTAAYNEAETLRQVFERSLATLRQCCDEYEIVILDDGSTDGTGAIAESLRDEHPDVVRVIRHTKNRGIAATFEELYQAGTKECIFDIPGDGEFPPEALHEIIPRLAKYDIVVCKRNRLRKYTLYRKIVSFFNRWLLVRFTGINIVEYFVPGQSTDTVGSLFTITVDHENLNITISIRVACVFLF